MQRKNEKEHAAGEEKIELHLYYVIGRARRRREKDISWPSSPIGTVSCTAFVLCHRTGRPEEPEDISWPSSPIGTEQEEEGVRVTEENLATSTLTVGN